jgi:hypothetical protein
MPTAPSQDDLARARLQMQRHEASEHRRRLMQGLGWPIISWEGQGFRLVAVGNTVHWSKTWRTFPDFLFDYIKKALTPEWGNAELKKPEDQRHPLLRWYRKLCDFQRYQATGKEGEIYSAPATGAVKAYLNLAYDLYLCDHNAELPERLLKRLRNRDQFEGALYEAFVIGCFAKAGFKIEFENEDDPSTSHCEFTATHSITGKKFSVEAKAVNTASKRSGASAEPPRIRGYLADALRKQAPHPRIVFIELSRTHSTDAEGLPEWIPHVTQEIAQAETQIAFDGTPAPPAYVFLTNRAFMHDLDGTTSVELWAAAGFKIDDFPPGRGARAILDAVHARERHLEVHWLFKAISTHREIPTTFDDRLPEELDGDMPKERLRIGDTYLVPNADGAEVPGVLEDAIVMSGGSKAWGTYRLMDGKRIFCTVPLTDAEMRAYARSPETFFGTLKHISKGIKEPLDAFDFVHGSYSKSTREKLLEFMADWPQIAELQKLGQKELAEFYAATVATQMWTDISKGRTKLSDK